MRRVFTIWNKELKESIRDKRTLMAMVIMPIVLMPLIMIGSLKLEESIKKSQEEAVAQVAVEGGQYAPELVEFLNAEKKIEVKEVTGDINEKINEGVIDVQLIIPADFSEKISSEKPIELKMVSNSTKIKSSISAKKVFLAINNFSQNVIRKRLISKQFNPNLINVIQVVEEDLATTQEKGGFFLGLLLPMFIILFTIAGGMYIAIDISAGEKERKTLEALLLTPTSRLQIVTGKFLAVVTTSVTSVVLSLISLYVAFKTVPLNFEGGVLEFNISPQAIGLMIGIGVILSISFAALLLSVSIFAKSFKEAQSYINPLYIAAILPVAIINSIPGFQPAAWFFLIPIVNAVALFKEVLLGVFEVSHILYTLISLLIFAVICILIATRIYSKERILFRD